MSKFNKFLLMICLALPLGGCPVPMYQLSPEVDYIEEKPILYTGNLAFEPIEGQQRSERQEEHYNKLVEFVKKEKICPSDEFEFQYYKFHDKNFLLIPIFMASEFGGSPDYEIICKTK